MILWFFWKTHWVAVFLFFVLFIVLELAVAILTKMPVISNKWLWRFRKKCSSQNADFIFKNAGNLIIILKLHVIIFSKLPVSWWWDAHLKFVTRKSIRWQPTLTATLQGKYSHINIPNIKPETLRALNILVPNNYSLFGSCYINLLTPRRRIKQKR